MSCSDALDDPKPMNPPCEILRMNERFNGAQTTVDRIDPATGYATPFYILHNNDEKAIVVLHADPRRQQQISDQALGTAKRHSLSSKIDVVFRGMEFKMKGDASGMGHKFEYMGVPYSWMLSRMSGSTRTIFLRDGTGQLLARWKKNPDGRFNSSKTPPTFEVYVPPQSIDMDMVIVTGLASIQYWIKEKKDSYEAVGEILGALA